MDKKPILMSIKPNYAEKIKQGEKRIELRRAIPKEAEGCQIAFYESSPVKKITMLCTVEAVISEEPERLWNQYSNILGISKERYDVYFKDVSRAYGLLLGTPKIIDPVQISALGTVNKAPQSYCYISEKDMQMIYHLGNADNN